MLAMLLHPPLQGTFPRMRGKGVCGKLYSREQLREQLCQRANIACFDRCAADPLQAQRQAALVFAVAAQVEQAVLPCQW